MDYLTSSMEVFDYISYRDFIKEMIRARSIENKGVITTLSKAMNIHSSLMSMILSGKRDLSIEQSFDLCQYFELTEPEIEFFILLVQWERAGTKRLKLHFKNKIDVLKKESKLLKNKVHIRKTLSEAEQSIFYSNWMYAAFHLYCGIGKNGKSLLEVCHEFKKPRKTVLEILTFLRSINLLTESDGRYQVTSKSTLLGLDSPFLIRHHMNWRNRALMRMDELTEAEFMISAPFSVSKSDFSKIRELLVHSVKKVTDVIQASPEEITACMNIDLFFLGSKTQIENEVENASV